jgi:hypothetical protein
MADAPQPPSQQTDPAFANPQAYYNLHHNPTNAHETFHNIDVDEAYNAARSKLEQHQTHNFVADIWHDSAWCAVNVSAPSIKSLLVGERPKELAARWINFWHGDSAAVEAIATQYGLSARLRGLLCPDAFKSGMSNNPRGAAQAQSDENSSSISAANEKAGDVEAAITLPQIKARFPDNGLGGLQGIKFGDIVNRIWHWCSTDFGPKYVCLGYNSLFSVPGKKLENGPNNPEGQRIWTWLLLCEDGTIISIFEDPFVKQPLDMGILKTIRKNVLNVFEHLSKVSESKDNSSSLMTVQIRFFDPTARPNDGHATEACLLLYYLFDDWMATYRIVAKMDHPYSAELEKIRENMSVKAKVDLVGDLHQIGRRLAVLKRVYQSYELIINRILCRQHLLRADAQLIRHQSIHHNQSLTLSESDDHHTRMMLPLRHYSTAGLSGLDHSFPGHAPHDVRLSQAASYRFERLLDRIRLYAVSEIDECIKEKEALVLMNFNLIALKESQAVEKLTRITILLAKATLLFLPVSLMTGYFSIQIGNIQNIYSLRTYWLCFVIVFAVSIVGLVFFGFAIGQVADQATYKSLWRIFSDFARKAIGERRKEKKH